VHYRPWQPRGYRREGYSGLRLLILGHSHYDDWSKNATRDWTLAHVQKKPDRFWTHIEQVVSGRVLDPKQRQEFWSNVAFSNFIQEPLAGVGPKPSRRQWQEARRMFPEVVECTRPDVVFVFSTTVWEHLPENEAYPGSRHLPGYGRRAYLYQIETSYRMLAGVFNHPRNPVRSREHWHAWSNTLLEAARRLRALT
jgi:hypothetical protein